MSRTLNRIARMAALLAGGKVSPRLFLKSLDTRRPTVTGVDGASYFCEPSTASAAQGCPDDDLTQVWQSQRVGILDGEYTVRGIVAKDSDGLFHAGLALEDTTGNEEVNWDAPSNSLAEARSIANAWLTASVPLGVVIYGGQPSAIH